MKKSQTLLLSSMMLCGAFVSCGVEAPEDILPVPQAKQVEWQKMETYAFVHFGLNTFTDSEWGYGDVSPEKFNPQNLDCEQWVRTFVKCGMKGVILTAKHHDGFCLWPFPKTEYSIANSPYRNGGGDLVGELAEACRKHGLKLGLYLSPWDRHHAGYGTQDYVRYYHAQLKDLLTRYGDLFEVWFDGANGGDGWYGGERTLRKIDARTYYDYPALYKMVEKYQPQAVIFSDAGPGCRWVGNERGYAGQTNWSFLRSDEVYPGYPKGYELTSGHADGDAWVPAESDVSVRPGWFFHPAENHRVKSVARLVDIYYKTVGRNSNLILNFPIDRNGRVHPADSVNAVEFRNVIKRDFREDLVAGQRAEVSSERGWGFKAKALTDGDYETYWSTPDSLSTGEICFRFDEPLTFNRLLLQEYIPKGQRVEKFAVEVEQDGRWRAVNCREQMTTIGYKRILRFDDVRATALRIRITRARGPLCISNVGVYKADRIKVRPLAAQYPSLDFRIHGVSADDFYFVTDKDDATSLRLGRDKVLFDMGGEVDVSTLRILPSQNGEGHILNYEVWVGSNLLAFDRKVAEGEFANIERNPAMQEIRFGKVRTRYLMLKAVRMLHPGEEIAWAEVAVE